MIYMEAKVLFLLKGWFYILWLGYKFLEDINCVFDGDAEIENGYLVLE